MSTTAHASSKPALPHARKWLLGGGFITTLLALLAVIVARSIPLDEILAQSAAAELETALGVPVSTGALFWQLLPSPRVELENAVIRQPQPIVINRLTLHLSGAALWQRRLKVDQGGGAGRDAPAAVAARSGFSAHCYHAGCGEKFYG